MVDRLHFTDSDEANALIASDALALLIGFALDQQVTVPTAFAGPQKLKERVGGLDAAKIAAMDPAELEAVFRQRPAIHRFPGSMARRVQELCAVIVDEYGGAFGLIEHQMPAQLPGQVHQRAAESRSAPTHLARRP